jgi:ComF family protein
MKRASELWTSVLDLLFPPRCQVCGALAAPPLCSRCREAIELLRPPWCRCCGLPLDPLARGGPLCRECRARPRRPFVAVRSAGVFGGTLRTAIHRFKYEGRRSLSQPLGELMVEFVEGQPEVQAVLAPSELDFVVPVPLHAHRYRQRGFNQSELLAEVLGAHWGLPVLPKALVRVRPTLPQVQLSGQERRRNVRRAFASTPGLPLEGATVLLVDDLYTTGATIWECAQVLQREQRARVKVLTLARACPLDLPESFRREPDHATVEKKAGP